MVFSPFHSNNNVSVTIYFWFLFKKNFLFFLFSRIPNFLPLSSFNFGICVLHSIRGMFILQKIYVAWKTPFCNLIPICIDFDYCWYLSIFIEICNHNTFWKYSELPYWRYFEWYMYRCNFVINFEKYTW